MHGKKIFGLVALSVLISAALAAGQNQATNTASQKAVVPLKVGVVFKEYQGTKLVSELPYTVPAIASEQGPDMSRLRMGLRVPIIVGSLGVPSKTGSPSPGGVTNFQFNYQSVGTEIDCKSKTLGGGLFDVYLDVSRTSIYPPNSSNLSEKSQGLALSRIAPYEPIMGTFSSSLDLVMRDGQTIESTMATDPVSGRVLKVDVTLHVLK